MTVPPEPPRGDEPEDRSDVDAEFARMMEGLDLDEPDAGTADPAAASAAGASTELPDPSVHDAEGTSDDAPLTVEDVLGAPAQDDAPRPVAVVATSVASAKALAGAIRLGSEARGEGTGVPAGTRVLSTGTGAIALGELDEAEAHALALAVSTALQKLGIILFWRRGDRMTATRYRQGARGDDVAPAIVLGGVDESIEQLLLGAVEASELGEGIDPSTVSRMQALRWIATGRRRG